MGVSLSSISPSSGPPGTAITCTGAGFDAGSRVGAPTLVPTTYVSATQITAEIPHGFEGADGQSMVIAVFVLGSDNSVSAALPFTVQFPAVRLEAWTTLQQVCGEIPGFIRNARVKDAQINTWMRSIAQSIAGAMLRRGLSTDPSTWSQPTADGAPAAAGVLEMINRLGAAARLAAAIAGEFGSAEWGLAKNLERAYNRELTALQDGDYDKLFAPGAATVEAGPQFAGGNTDTPSGRDERSFYKRQVF